MKVEIQNHDGICRLISGDYEIVLAEGDAFILELDDGKMMLRLKREDE